MSVFDLMVDGFPHGLPAGYEQGCRGARGCANYGTELPLCRDAAVRYRADFGYKKCVDQGMSPVEILAVERAAAEAVRPQVVAARRALAEKAERAQAALRDKERAKAQRAADRAQERLERAAERQRERAEAAAAKKLPVIGHGSLLGYWEGGCYRNDICPASPSCADVNLAALGVISLAETNPKVARAVVQRVPRVSKPRVVKPHGTNASYARGCHCAECREANRLYMADYRAKRQAEGARPESHGTAWGYAQGCRKRSECPGGPDGVKCPDASLAAERERRRRAGVAAAAELTHAGPVRERMQELMAAGMPLLTIAEVAGVSKSVLKNLLYGRSGPRQGEKSAQVSVVNAEKVLALVPGNPRREMREQ